MIEFPRTFDAGSEPVVRLAGLGNAGIGIVDRIAMRGGTPLETLAINSDDQSLQASVASVKITLGPLATHGLGAGGDPEMGLEAARESRGDIEKALQGTDLLMIVAGLGGGTGSGALPMIAEAAKNSGTTVVALVAMPFGFEGRRRSQQADESLQRISSHADAVVRFDNDRMAGLTAPRAGVGETFAVCDGILFKAALSLLRLASPGGPVPVGLPGLLATLRAGDGACLFGSGDAEGANRSHDALEQALRSPLLDRGRLLNEAGGVLVHISGPGDMTFAEVATVMSEISKHIAADATLHFGVSTTDDPAESFTVGIVGRCGSPRKASPPATRAEPAPPAPREAPREAVPEPPQPAPPKAATPAKKTGTQREEQPFLPFDQVKRGRFEKVEPTMFEGEDLDVPTFLRKQLKK